MVPKMVNSILKSVYLSDQGFERVYWDGNIQNRMLLRRRVRERKQKEGVLRSHSNTREFNHRETRMFGIQ